MILLMHKKFMKSSELLDRLLDMFDEADLAEREKGTADNKPINLIQLSAERKNMAILAERLDALVDRPPEREDCDWGFSDCDEACRCFGCPGSEADDLVSAADSFELRPPEPSPVPDSVTTIALNYSINPSPSSSSLSSIASSIPPPSPSPDPFSVASLFLDLNEELVVQQLNLVEGDIFGAIGPRDLLHSLWSRVNRGQHAPTVAASIRHFNYVSSWVVTTVLSSPSPAIRASLLLKFMRIAHSLRLANNFNTLMAVLAGLSSTPLQRLRATHRLIPDIDPSAPGIQRAHRVLERLMSSERSFAGYRQALRRAEMPCIPYLGVFLRDLLYIDEANKDRRADGCVNLAKFLLMGDVIVMMKSFQLARHSVGVQRDPTVLGVILDRPLMTDDEAYERSLELEPRTAKRHPSNTQ
ncbi:hypothetical protein HK101_007556 [Irineochytrium annulatum]|nr:hypothetical protein HK101_007556 [Irineochytrium annulatum]